MPGPVRWIHDLGVRRPRPEDSVAWEIEHHIEELVDRLVDEGWEEAAARQEAARKFGDPRRYGPSMQRLEKGRMTMEKRMMWADFFRQGLGRFMRGARRSKGFTAAVIVTLALGIGANATMYGIVDRLLLQPPQHIDDPASVRRVVGQRPSFITGETLRQETLTYPDYADLKEHRGFVAVAPYTTPQDQTVGAGEDATRAAVALAGHEFFPLLGVSATRGRFFEPEEAKVGAPLTAVISEEYWARAYGADPGAVGRVIEISGRDHTIVGVAPKGFTGVGLVPVDVWLPLEASHQGDCLDMRGCWWMMAVARLATGVTVEAAEEEATRLHLNGRRDMVERGRYSEEARILLTSLIAAEGPDASAETHVARWLTGVSLIVLLIACANVANLLLARGTRQRREVAVRLALGVDRTRLMGHLMFESILLALSGGLVALLVARWGGGFVRSALLPGVYFPDSAVNGRVLAFAAVASVVAGVIAGLGPAIQSIRTDVSVDLAGGARGGSDRRSRLRGLLTVSQAAMSVVLLIGAGLFVRSLGELRSLDLGLDPDRLLLVNLELRSSSLDRADQIAVYEEAARRVEALPDVESAAFTSVPFQWGFATSLEVPGLDSIPTLPGGGPYYFPTSPGYFSTLGVGIVRGRALDASDTEGSQLVAVVSETMARTLWPGQEALGQCLMVGYGAEACTDVVGVAEDAARGGFQDRPFMAYYLPLEQVDDATPQGLYVRVARGDAATAAATVSPLLRSFSPLVRYANVRSFEEILDPLARSWTLGAAMFTIFGLLALCVAMIGLYSVLAFDVAQRTRELGIRMALGAAKRRLLVGILVSGGRLAVLGVVLGIGAAWLAAPYAGELLFETSPHDPWVIGVVALTLIGVAAVASILPGLRATRVDPMVALRSE